MCRSSESRILIHWLGINFSFAKTLLGKHCNVLFADLALRPEAKELVSNHASSSQSPARAVFQQTDVRDWQQLERMFQVATKEFGGADIVCPGAGVYEPVHRLTPTLPPPHSNKPPSPSPTSGIHPALPPQPTPQPPTATPSSTST